MNSKRRDELISILSTRAGEYISGEELARYFGCSRAAVWKLMKALRTAGYAIEAATNHGYRLSSSSDAFQRRLDDKLIRSGLHEIFTVHVGERTQSTNSDARKAGEQSEKEFSVFVSLSQTNGRGRRGKTFLSDNDEGLWFSILLRPDLPLREASSITLLFGLVVLQAISKLCHIHVGLKWPNDIISLQNGKKICGILSETSMEECRISYAVIGCGINISQTVFPEEIQDIATSLFQLGAIVEKEDLLSSILSEISAMYPAFLADPTAFLPVYRANCVTIGRRVRVMAEQPYEGVAEGISNQGDLLVRTDDNKIQICTSGEVSIR